MIVHKLHYLPLNIDRHGDLYRTLTTRLANAGIDMVHLSTKGIHEGSELDSMVSDALRSTGRVFVPDDGGDASKWRHSTSSEILVRRECRFDDADLDRCDLLELHGVQMVLDKKLLRHESDVVVRKPARWFLENIIVDAGGRICRAIASEKAYELLRSHNFTGMETHELLDVDGPDRDPEEGPLPWQLDAIEDTPPFLPWREDMTRAGYSKRPMFYLRSAFRQPMLDVYRASHYHMISSPRFATHLVVSQKFRQACIANGIRCDFYPAEIVDDPSQVYV